MPKDRRYVITMDMYLYAENDYMAEKGANEIVNNINKHSPSAYANIKELGEQPFASMNYRLVEIK